jgi:hypothetical protein
MRAAAVAAAEKAIGARRAASPRERPGPGA